MVDYAGRLRLKTYLFRGEMNEECHRGRIGHLTVAEIKFSAFVPTTTFNDLYLIDLIYLGTRNLYRAL